MPRGRQPDGEQALSNAERQARYRARRRTEQPPALVRYRRPADRRARPQRWHAAVTELVTLQAEYVAWLDALPDKLRDSATAEALQASTVPLFILACRVLKFRCHFVAYKVLQSIDFVAG